MASLLTLGECMLELQAAQALQESHQHKNNLQNNDNSQSNSIISSFAGDTYNTAVYAKRQAPSVDVSFGSVIGHDPYSISMKKTCLSHGLNVSLLGSTSTANIGIYAVATDDTGEKQFFYWRKQSAATQLCTLFTLPEWQACSADIIYFSGITLAILSAEDRDNLLQALSEKQQQGSRIAFDPNYRARLWESETIAKEYIEKSYQLADIAFPGLEDHQTMYGHASYQEINAFLKPFNISEQIVKCDDQGVYIYVEEALVSHQPFVPAPQQVDTTAAGDSFAGSYLASRLNDQDTFESLKNACDTAREVVQHRGAIIPV